MFRKGQEIYGLASPFTFYTIDKPGYISGGFSQDMVTWNYPVCRRCAIWMLIGKEYMDHHLKFSAFGKTFYLIPSPFNKKQLPTILNQYNKLNDEETFAGFRQQYLNREDKIFRYLGESDNSCTINFYSIKKIIDPLEFY